MIGAVLLLVTLGIIAMLTHRRYKHKKTEAFRKLVEEAAGTGRWAEIITLAHQTMPADEVRKLEHAMYMHSQGSGD